MVRHALKTGLIVAVFSFVLQGTNAFGRGGGASGWYAGFGNGMWSYAGFGGPGGWGAPGFGYTGNGWSLSAARPNTKASSSTRTAADSMTLTVTVPADAKVFVNGHATTSIGETRQYSSAGLRPGSKYDYQVRAEFVRDGRAVSEEKTISMIAGQRASLAFDDAQVADMAASRP